MSAPKQLAHMPGQDRGAPHGTPAPASRASAEDAPMTDPRLLTEPELQKIQVIVRGAGYRHPDARHLAARVIEHIETMPLTTTKETP